MKRARLALALLAVLVFPTGAGADAVPREPAGNLRGLPGLPAGVDLTAAERALLARGESVVRLTEPSDGARTRPGFGLRVLDAPPERVFRTVADHAHYPEYVPYLTASRAVVVGGETLLEQRLDLPMPLPDRGYRLRPYARVSSVVWEVGWRHVPGSGNVAGHEGHWTLSRYPGDRTLVVFSLAGDFVPHLPGAFQDRVLRRSLPWILDGLAQQVNRCRYDEPVAVSCGEERASSLHRLR